MKVRGAIADESLLHRQLLGVSVIALRKLDTLLSQTRVFDFNTCTQLHTQRTHTHTHTHTHSKRHTHMGHLQCLHVKNCCSRSTIRIPANVYGIHTNTFAHDHTQNSEEHARSKSTFSVSTTAADAQTRPQSHNHRHTRMKILKGVGGMA